MWALCEQGVLLDCVWKVERDARSQFSSGELESFPTQYSSTEQKNINAYTSEYNMHLKCISTVCHFYKHLMNGGIKLSNCINVLIQQCSKRDYVIKFMPCKVSWNSDTSMIRKYIKTDIIEFLKLCQQKNSLSSTHNIQWLILKKFTDSF